MNEIAKSLIQELEKMDTEEKVKSINEIKEELKKISPFANEPVDCVQWVKEELVIANDYNPNTVAPPKWNYCIHPYRKMDIHSLSLYISTMEFTR